MREEQGHSLILAFDSNSRRFAMGFEAGVVFARLRDGIQPFDCEMHIENASMIMKIAEATDRDVHTVERDDIWLTAFFSEVRS